MVGLLSLISVGPEQHDTIPPAWRMTYFGVALPNDGSILVMHLEPGAFEDAIRFRLEILSAPSRHSNVNYEAVSYTWSDGHELQDVFCTNSSSDSLIPIKVTKNCYSALRNLRYADHYRILWLDAVCIDQSNVAERSAQVEMMGIIYANASRVVVYLGETADNSDLALKHMEYEHGLDDYPRRDISVPVPSEDDVAAFTDRPWFYRTWVLQEVTNAPDVLIQCGMSTLTWQAMDDYFRYGCPPTPVQKLLATMHKLQDSRDTTAAQTLLGILEATRPCLTSDPRDRIYGVLPLLKVSQIPENVRPDYNIQATDLLVRVANYLYSHIGPNLLEHTLEMRSMQSEALPSWVPQWSRIPKWPLKIDRADQHRDLRAGGPTLQACIESSRCLSAHDPRRLRIKGVSLGQIIELASALYDVQHTINQVFRNLVVEADHNTARMAPNGSCARQSVECYNRTIGKVECVLPTGHPG